MKFFSLVFLLLYSSSAFSLDGYFSVGYGQGGSPLADVTGGQNYDIKAGSGMYLVGGVILPISPTEPHRFELQIGAGYMEDHRSAEFDNSATWSRIPIEAIYFYRNTVENFRIGWGAIYQTNNKITAKGTDVSEAMPVDDANGWTIAADYLKRDPDLKNMLTGVGIRYNAIRYRASGFSGDANGESWFVTVSLLY